MTRFRARRRRKGWRIVGDEVVSEGVADPDATWLALHAERERLERALSLAQARQRFGTDAEAIARAGAELSDLLLTLDRVMTMIRAAEYRRRPGARRW